MSEKNHAWEALPPDFHPPKQYVLGKYTRRILLRMAELILPRNERLQVDCAPELVNYVDNYLRYLPPLFKWGFPLGIWIFQLAAIVMSGRPLPFTMLGAERQARYLNGWVHAKAWWRRDLLKGLKGVLLMGFYQHPEVMRLINYQPAPFAEEMKARRLANYAHHTR